ncbi:glycosyltransferase [Devosia sp. A16]|uniref:glycosyltransferase n=1 Tax=Devosia sp. A16 TaxID=1736675 RepID=UPI0018D14939|nr:glycosyltransferase [Devosia sp. A16]
MRAEVELLRRAGHTVRLEIVDNHTISGIGAKIETFFATPYNPARFDFIIGLIREFRPDVVHIHNFFPLFTPAVHEGARAAGVAVVQTLQNYRLFCAGAFFLREGRICEKCLHGARYWGVVHRCYRNSLPGSVAVVRMQNRAFSHRTWDSVDRFIALTDFARAKCIEAGLSADRIAVKPNTLPLDWQTPGKISDKRSGALYVGRLSREKGVDVLLEAWRQLPDVPLTVVGSGPEEAALKSSAPPGVRFLGALQPEDVRTHMKEAACLIMPSRWYEGLPLTAIEAFSLGLPIICSRIGSLAEIVEHDSNGWHFETNSTTELAERVRSCFSTPGLLAKAGQEARASFHRQYSGDRNLEMLTGIYQQAIASAKLRALPAVGQGA